MALSSFGKRLKELKLIFFYLISVAAFSEAVLLNANNRQTPEVFVASGDSSFDNAREKRAAKTADIVVSPLATAVHLNNSHLHLMVHWAGQGSPVVFCLGRDQEMKIGATSQVFRSDDYGLSYNDISSKFLLDNGERAVINKFYHHPKTNCRYVFTDILNRYIFMSKDCGSTFTSHNLATITPSQIDFDERRDSVFLIHDLISPERRLHVTKNFGETFSPVQDFVKSFFLRYMATETVLYVQRLEPSDPTKATSDQMRTTILSSKNFFEKQIDTNVVYIGAKEFQVMGDYLFVTAASKQSSGDDSKGLDLFISMHGERFVRAKFEGVAEKNLTTIDYHIVNVTSDGEIIIVVNHNSVLSNLYTSSRITPHEVFFSLSLERVMYYSPNITWEDSWLSATSGDKPFADVYEVQGLRGIFIASQINPDAWAKLHSGSASKGSSGKSIEPKDLVSLITFNGGGLWSPIRGPVQDEEGRNVTDCAELPDGSCSLHLAQQLSKKFPSTRSIPIMTSSSAVGIIIGTGNVGKHLKQRSNVFLSADAGVSWHQVLKGSYYFHIGDHGGIIVAVKYFKSEGSTNELLYSTNEGIKWEKLVFYSEPLRVFGLLAEPGENSVVFTIFGTTGGSASINWIIVNVNLASVFERNCTEADYKRWSPSDNTVGKHRSCLLGRKEIYERRMVNANCFNGREREKLVTVENCFCDRSDYQCDFGFHRDQEWSGACVRDPLFDDHDFYSPPGNCKPGKFYNQSRGYIKIRGDTCVGGRDNMYEPLRVACPVEEEKEFLLVAQRPNILRIDLRNLSHVDVLPLTQIQNVIALEFDLAENCVMYGDIELDKIFIQCLNGTPPRVLVENNLSVEGMSYDWIGKNLYFVDGQKKTIELVRTTINYAGRMRKTILNKDKLGKPRGIVVHPKQGLLFYSDWHESKPHIGRANMDGHDQKVLFGAPLVQWPNGLSIDPLSNRLYWVDAQKDYIGSCDLDGKGFKRVLDHHTKLVHPFAVTIHKDLVYWDDWEKKAIFMADKNSGKGVVKVSGDLAGAMDMKAYNRLYQVADNNSCSAQPCSHLCIPTPSGYSCVCPDGLKRHEKSDGRVVCLCADDKTEAFANGTCPMLTSNGDGKPLTCDAQSQFSCDNRLCVPKLWHCDGDDDCGDGSDEKECENGSGGRAVCKGNQFACANGEKCIPNLWRCDFDNDCSDWSDEADCNRTTCGENFFKCSNGQCISNKWRCDLEKDCQDGSDEENCTQVVPECKPDEFQCGDAGQCLPVSWKCDGENDCPGGEDEKNCESNQCQDWQFGCADGHCIFQTWHCDGDRDCTDGSDEANCTEVADGGLEKTVFPVPTFPKGSECNEWMFRCNNEQCIPYWWKCDGSPDCADKSDELECGQTHTQPGFVSSETDNDDEEEDNYHGGQDYGVDSLHCGPTKFACTSGECIWQAWVCDGQNDCENGEDEDDEICSGRPPPCDPNLQFRCERSGQCISYDQICDGHQDCTDNSDELGCETLEPNPVSPVSPNGCKGPGVFSCDFGQCFPESAMCDGHLDCVDGTDEPANCPKAPNVGRIVGLTVSNQEMTSHSIRVDWTLTDISGADKIEYQPSYTIAGEDHWIYLNWTHLHDMSYTFEGLYPFTKYNFCFNTRNGDKLNRNCTIVSGMTSPDIPGSPTITDVKQVKDNVQIDWTQPSQPNGVVIKYIVSLYPVRDDGTIDSSAGGGGKVWSTETAAQTSYVIGALEPDRKYAFTVKAVNSHYTGNASQPYIFVYKRKNKEKVSGLEISGQPQENSVTLKWTKMTGNDEIEYKVSTKSDNLIAQYGDIVVKNSVGDNSVIESVVGNLSPNTSYIFSVAVVIGGVAGPAERVFARTSGKSLPKPNITDAQVTPESGTAIKLTWKLADDEKRTTGWTYGIFYGSSPETLLLNGQRNVTDGQSFTVRHLDACESYSFVVAIVGPTGFGIPSNVFTKQTKYSPGAAPKNLKAELDKENRTRIVVSWQSSCSTVDKIGYLIFIEDTSTGQKTQVKLAPQDLNSFRHVFDSKIHFGTTYRFYVKTDDPNSLTAGPVNITTIPIPVPESLIYHPDMNSSAHVILWQIPEKKLKGYLLDDFKKGAISYRIYLSSNSNMSSPEKTINVTSTSYRLPMSELVPGKMYFLAATLVDKDGYESRMSDPIAIESPVSEKSIVVSPSNVAEVLVPILLVIVVLGAALAYYVQRNRRLSRSFAEFASRYSPASGSASILNHSALDDDDDYTPIIRGFSDNEPLVVSS